MILVFGTFDTKGKEIENLITRLKAYGSQVVTLDLGTQKEAPFIPDYPAEKVAEAAGSTLSDVKNNMDRASALKVMAAGGKAITEKLWNDGVITAAVSMGGSQGTYMATQIMSELPIGFPKLLVSTVAGHQGLGSLFEGIKDTFIVNSVVDVLGSNSILNAVIDETAAVICQLEKVYNERQSDCSQKRKRIAITMWGVTTPCVEFVRDGLEKEGFETFVFHANGMGGATMESLIRQGEIQGVVDITLAEVGNTLCEGNSVPVQNRLSAAAEMGIPAIISVGGLDMISMFPPFDKLPEKYVGRKQYYHEENVLFVRSNAEENIMFAEEIAKQVNNSKGITKVMLPLKGISSNDYIGNNFYDSVADEALFMALEKKLNDNVEIIKCDFHINDKQFAELVTNTMIEMMK